jgi:hypothetical protein
MFRSLVKPDCSDRCKGVRQPTQPCASLPSKAVLVDGGRRETDTLSPVADRSGKSCGSRCAITVRRCLVIAVFAVTLLSIGPSYASTSRAHEKTLVSRTLLPSRGGLVRRAGVALYVPPGAMARKGVASIVRVKPHVYGIHITVPWHGTVAVSLPLRGRHDTIVHQLSPGVWVAEGKGRGDRTVWVTQLSHFSDFLTNLSGIVCLRFEVEAVLQCLANKGISHVNSKILSWIEGKMPSPCAASLVATAYQNADALVADVAKTVYAAINPDGECAGHAGDTVIKCPDGSYHVICPSQAQTTTPTKAAPPQTLPHFGVQNTSETLPDGVWFRNSPHTADTQRITGLGIYAHEMVQLNCYEWGDAVGPYGDTLWYQVSNLTRPTVDGLPDSGFLNAHYIADGQKSDVVDAGVPPC